MATCGESAYQMVENATGPDLTFAKLVLAQINSIDAETNTANVTIADECMQGVDTSAVPFFYHCQFADGSLEDLTFGYSAFAPSEWVWILYIPASGEDAAEIYIHGHSDIRGTILCNLPIAVGLQTVGEDEVLWEKYLEQCVPPPAVFLPSAPIHLMNLRYVYNGVIASIIVYQTVENYWHVIVDRRGADVIRYDYYPALDGLVVSAALSEDLNSLYVVESRLPGSDMIGTYHQYSFADGAWSETATGTVPHPSTLPSTRPFYVNRDGEVAGYWAISYTPSGTPDIDHTESGTYCIGADGYTKDWSHRDYEFFGHSWSIITQEFISGTNRNGGFVFKNGDIFRIQEDPGSTFQTYYLFDFAFTNSQEIDDPLDNTWTWTHTRDEDKLHQHGLSFSSNIEAVTTYNSGLYYSFTASYLKTAHNYRVNPSYRERHIEIDVTFSNYVAHDGTKSIGATFGGWAVVAEVGSVTVPDLTPYHFEEDVDGSTDYDMPTCYDLDLNVSSAEAVDVDTKNIVYPINIGEYYSIERSFSSYDQASETEYIGVMVKFTSDGEPEWRVYKDRELVTDEIEACIGIPIENLHAIYFRA